MFAGVTSQIAYNFWDRIGDLIASFFPDNFKPYDIYFPKVIDAIPTEFKNEEGYLWLKQIKENEYLELNKMRKQIVHYTTLDTEFKNKHLEYSNDRDAIESLQNEREYIADFYKNHISLTLTGFEKTLLFLEAVNHKLLNNLE